LIVATRDFELLIRKFPTYGIADEVESTASVKPHAAIHWTAFDVGLFHVGLCDVGLPYAN
jgi:hypothetical protein